MAREKTADGEFVNDTWATPEAFVTALNRFVHTPPTLDVCASAENAKYDYYIDRETNALGSISWLRLLQNAGAPKDISRVAFCNPGYSNVLPWCERAEWEARVNGWQTYILAHDNFCGPWFRHAAKHAARIYLLYPRIQFIPPPGIKKSTNARCSTLLWYAPPIMYGAYGKAYSPRMEPHIVYTDWRKW